MALSYDESQIAADRAVVQAQGSLGSWTRRPADERMALAVRAERLILSGLPWLEAVNSLDLCADIVGDSGPRAEWLGMLVEDRGRGGRWGRISEEELAVRQPGVAAVIIPGDYPMALVATATVRLLSRGHAVILAPQGDAGRKVRRLWQVLSNAGIPQGVVHVVDVAGAVVRLLGHPAVSLALHLGAASVVLEVPSARRHPGEIVALPSARRPRPK